MEFKFSLPILQIKKLFSRKLPDGKYKGSFHEELKKTHLKTVFPQLLHGVIMNAAFLNYYKFS